MHQDRDIYYNDQGILLEQDIRIVRPEFCLPGKDTADWALIQHGDKDGFDIRIVYSNGKYTETIILPPGKRLLRYGFPGGSFTADIGTDYDLLSLPYIRETMPYHEYVVKKECRVECIVTKGIVAPGFNSLGGAVQYKHQLTISDSIEYGILEEDYTWIRNKLAK